MSKHYFSEFHTNELFETLYIYSQSVGNPENVREQACTVQICFFDRCHTVLVKRIKTSEICTIFGAGTKIQTPGIFSLGDSQKPVQIGRAHV